MSKKQSRKGKYIAKALRNPVPKKKQKIQKKEESKEQKKNNKQKSQKIVDVCIVCDLTENNNVAL